MIQIEPVAATNLCCRILFEFGLGAARIAIGVFAGLALYWLVKTFVGRLTKNGV